MNRGKIVSMYAGLNTYKPGCGGDTGVYGWAPSCTMSCNNRCMLGIISLKHLYIVFDQNVYYLYTMLDSLQRASMVLKSAPYRYKTQCAVRENNERIRW